VPLANARRSGRISKEIPVLLIGSDTRGRVFAEQTQTVILSRYGAGVISRYELVPEQEMIIRLVETNKEAEMRVVGRIGPQSRGEAYGLTFLDTDRNFWGAHFPSAADSEKETDGFVFECDSCGNRKTISYADIEFDVYQTNDRLTYYCNYCGLSTIWKPPSGAGYERSMAPTSSNQSKAAPTSGRALGPGNRRKRIRAKVDVAGCVRYASFNDDVVACEDMSRGGLRFTSRKRYYERSIIEVAAPYSPGEQGIFVRAEIVYVLALPELKRFRCGVAYIKSS
jgi:hypothetical protein